MVLGKGMITGFLVALVPGVIMVVLIRRILSKSLKSGIISGFGAATGNLLAATIAAFFLGIAIEFIEENQEVLLVFFGIILVIMGINIFIKNPDNQILKNQKRKSIGNWNDFFSVFLIAFTNPGFFLTFTAFFAFWGIRGDWIDKIERIWLLGGVFLGATIWWIMFSYAISKLRKIFKMRYITFLNRFSGGCVIILGLVAVLSSLM